MKPNDTQENLFTQILNKADKKFHTAFQLHDAEKYRHSTEIANECMLLHEKLGNRNKVFELKKLIAANFLAEHKVEQSSCYLENLLEETIDVFGHNHSFVAEVFNQLGYLYTVVLKDIEKGIEYDEKCLKIRLKLKDIEQAKIAYSYNNLGYSYGEMEDYDKQLLYYQKALRIRQQMYVEPHEDLAESYNNLGRYYQSVLKDYTTAIGYHQKALKIRQNLLGKYHHLTAFSHENLGSCAMELGAFEEALKHQLTAFSIHQQAFGKAHPTIANAYALIGSCHTRMENWEQAIGYFQQSWRCYIQVFPERHRDTARVLMYWSHALLQNGDIQSALVKIQEAIRQVLKKGQKYHSDVHYVYQATDFTEASNLVIEILQGKAKVLLAYFDGIQAKERFLESALQNYCLTIEVIDQQRNNFHSEQSKLLLEDVVLVYEEGLELAMHISSLYARVEMQHLAFTFAEKAKAAFLLSTLKGQKAKLNAHIPAHLLDRERQLRVQLTLLDKKIRTHTEWEKATPPIYQNESSNENAQKELTTWQNTFFDLHVEYDALIKQLEKDYPHYYERKYAIHSVSATDLQQILEENQLIVSYFIGQEKIIVFVVNQEEIEIIDLQKPADFNHCIQQFLKGIQEHRWDLFNHFGQHLYGLLILPIQDFITELFGMEQALQRVFVIPHGVLSYVPFEALIGGGEPLSETSPTPLQRGNTTVDKVGETLSTVADLDNSWSTIDYLIHHCEISYHYSATLLYHHLLQKQSQETLPNSFAGFAPVYDTTVSPKNANSIPPSFQYRLSNEKPKTHNAFQQSVRTVQTWAARSEAIRSDGTWVSLPHSETETKGIAQLFAEKGLEGKTFLREKANKEGFTEASKRYKFLLVAAHGLVNDEQTALSGLVFYPETGDSLPRNLGGERQTADGAKISNNEHRTPNTQYLISNNEHRTLNNEYRTSNNEHRTLNNESLITNDQSLITNHQSLITNHQSLTTNNQSDNILSMEETHHLDLQADLVVLSSCESGIGTLHKGEGMMAVNRGFLAAGANNVVSTLFKVYDKPSSLLTQYLFEEILEGKAYAEALRLAKLKLMQQPNIDPKSWSGFVLIGG